MTSLLKQPEHDKLTTVEWLQLCVGEARFALHVGLFFGLIFGIGIGISIASLWGGK